MVPMEKIIGAYKRNTWIINKQTENLSDADALIQPPFRGNCLNWVLGHILAYRDVIVKAFGAEGFFTEEEKARYGYGSEPVVEEEELIISLTRQMEILNQQETLLIQLIQEADEEKLLEEVDYEAATGPIIDMIFYFYFHDTYHTGQLEYLRQLAGKNDKVI